MSNQPDINVLKERIANGDFDALNFLYRHYYRKLKLYGIRFSPQLSSLSVEDTIQELFLWIFKNPTQLNSIENLEVYLFSALKRNIFQDIYKGQSRKNLMVVYSDNSQNELYENSSETKFIEAETRRYDKSLVKQLLDSLPEKQKEVLYLRTYINMSYREIAEVMGLSEQIVRNYNYRAMQNLKSNHPQPFLRKDGSNDGPH